jgi:serine/threonine protein kinase
MVGKATAQAVTSRMFDPGTVVAERYRIGRKLGEGGMGSVYECEHVRVGKRFAIKVLDRRDTLPPEAIERFEREARAPSLIHHPNVVETFDVGVEPDGTRWMVMDLLEGETLQDVLARDRVVQPEQLARIMDQLLDCLAAMHGAAIVHRDLKPANIFLVGDRSTVKLLDFGIAKAVGEDHGTRSGYVIGTPAYMAPEQMRNARSATARSDLWSVGVILHECLVGFRPFRGETFALLAQIAGSASHARLSDIAGELPPALAALVDRCLSKDPALRPASATSLREELLPLLARLRSVRPIPPPVDPDDVPPDADPALVAHAATEHSPRLTSSPGMDSSRPASPRSVEGPPRRGLAIAAGILAGCIVTLGVIVALRGPSPAATSRPRSDDAVPPIDRAPPAEVDFAPLSRHPDLTDTLARWSQAVTVGRGRVPLDPFYANSVQIHGSNALATPTSIRALWRAVFAAGATLSFDWDRTRFREREPALSASVPAACINVPGATGRVLEVRAWAREHRPDRSADIGCQDLEGIYLLRLRKIGDALKICHETWSLQHGICASCPTAPVCLRR